MLHIFTTGDHQRNTKQHHKYNLRVA